MRQLLNPKSKFWYNTRLYFSTSMVAVVVMAFVFVSYLALTHNDTPPKKTVETEKRASIERAVLMAPVIEING